MPLPIPKKRVRQYHELTRAEWIAYKCEPVRAAPTSEVDYFFVCERPIENADQAARDWDTLQAAREEILAKGS